jgi:hypothetical protein
MALYTGPLYHLEDWSENVENHNKLADDLGGLGRDSLRNEGYVQRCPEKSMSFLALFWALEWNQNIFSSHKQAVRHGMRWPAVPTP